MMRARLLALTLLLAAAAACALRGAMIADIQRNSGHYVDRTVTIEGRVTTAWGLPLLPFKLYRVDDGTGQLTVVSRSVRTPTTGARVRVKGRVSEVAVLGGRPLGLHLEERTLKIER
jgi:hypothetical protein